VDAVRRAAALVLAASALVLAGAPAGAVPSAAEPPRSLSLEGGGGTLTVTADEMSFSNQSGVVDFTGNVTVVRSDMRMEARRLTVTLDRDGESAARRIQRMVAQGEVTFIYGERTATAGRAEYDPLAGTVVLTEKPRVADPAMTVVGTRITIDLETQESTVEGGAFTFTEGP
jgi:lipopolysaccharide export system protein LptA